MSRRHVHFATGVPEAAASDKNNVTGGKSDSASAAQANEKNETLIGRGDIVISDQGAEEEASLPVTSNSTAEATKVISGMRANATVLIWVDVARSMHEGGLKWWRSDNGVILTEGDARGIVSMDWVDRVERKATGERLFIRQDKS